jgi:UDP-N-acetylglucosamine 2-epimerase
MQKIKYKSIWILPNNDSGGEQIKRLILSNLRIQDTTHNNLDRRTYISLLKHAKFIIGNSSSGILEAPSLHLPAINIGRRQDGRIQGANVLNVDGFDSDQIVRVVNEAVKIKASGFLESQPNPYGDGKSSDRILETLEQTKITSELLQKKISY